MIKTLNNVKKLYKVFTTIYIEIVLKLRECKSH